MILVYVKCHRKHETIRFICPPPRNLCRYYLPSDQIRFLLRALELHFVYSCVFKFPRDIIRIYLGQEYPVDNPCAVGGWLVGGKVFEFEFACLYGWWCRVHYWYTSRYVYFAISMNMRVFLCTLHVSIYVFYQFGLCCQMGNCMMFGNL